MSTPGDSRGERGLGRRRRTSRAVVETEAARWLSLREARGFTVAEHASFADWCERDPRHAAMFAEMETAWRAFDRLDAFPHSSDRAADPDLLAPAAAATIRTWLSRTTLIAAALALAAMGWLRPWRESESVITSAAAVSGRFVSLPDGSTVELNAGADVAARFTATERRIELVRGEAHFSVAKDPRRPFVVAVGGVDVRAVGTAFNVRFAREEIEVLVTEGKVQVAVPRPAEQLQRSPPAGSAVETTAVALTPGERTLIGIEADSGRLQHPVVDRLAESEIDRRLAWQKGRIVFDSTPLVEAIARIGERPNSPRLVLGDDQVGSVLLSGRIRADHLENFVEVLEVGFGVDAERKSDGTIVLRKRR